jgi:glyoxylase-like metal-dependent hydrolase (beta-lactamase superfamily II)
MYCRPLIKEKEDMLALPLLLAASVIAPPDPGRPGPHQAYELVTLADGVYAFIAPEGRTGTVQGNSMAVVGDDGVLVVDTGQFPELTRRMIADIRKLTVQPVRFVVNTHWHGDHLLGNHEYKVAFPAAVVVQHAETRRLADKSYPGFAKSAATEFPQYVKDLRAALTRGTRRSGQDLSDLDKDYYGRQADELEAAIRELDRMPHTPADVTFESGLTVHLGKREVRILHLGRGNTGGDTVIHVPDAKVVAAGDMVVYPSPYSFGSRLGEWVVTLRKLQAMGATHLVPGHGPVLGDGAYVNEVIDLIEDTRRQVLAAVKDGLGLDDTRKRVDLTRFRQRLAGEDYWRGRAFDEFYLQPAVEQAYKEAKREAIVEGVEG